MRLLREHPTVRALRDIADAIDAPVVATDPAGIVTLCNAATLTLLGRTRDQLLGQPVEDLFTQGELLSMHQQAGRGQRATGQIRLQRPEGIRTYEVGASPRPAAPGEANGVVLTLRDVSELATAMQLKTDFVANASHELRTPLAAIRSAVDTLADLNEDESRDSQDGRDANAGQNASSLPLRDRLTRMIAGSASRLEELMNDLLDLSRMESPEAVVHVRPMDPRELPVSLGPMFDAICLDRDLEVTFNIPSWLDRIDSDRQLVELVLKNLVDNACKYAHEGTTIRVTIEAIAPPTARAAKLADDEARPATTLRMEVADRGLGVPIQDQPRVFERFYQVDQSRAGGTYRRGTGLGLAIVKHAVRSLGGTIGFESVWKQGSTFWVELPEAVPESVAALADRRLAAKPVAKNAKPATSGSEPPPRPGAGADGS